MSFHALVARGDARNYEVSLEQLTDADLPESPASVLVDVAYSSLNYKDALAVTRKGRIVRDFPMVLGIDLAGRVLSDDGGEFKPGDLVLGTGQGLGELTWGGYSQRQRVAANTIIRVPAELSLEQAMQLGTAGLTAMLCVMALERNGVVPDEREVVVTGAAGGVGSIAVMLLAKRGYRVAASTGRPQLEDYLRSLGATSIIPRDELAAATGPMQAERWAGGVDTVGGNTLANLYAQIVYGGAVACCGMAGGHELNTTVWPLILRNVSYLGVSSLLTPKAERMKAWSRLAAEVDRAKLAELSRTEPLSKIFELSKAMFEGGVRGRVVIDVGS